MIMSCLSIKFTLNINEDFFFSFWWVSFSSYIQLGFRSPLFPIIQSPCKKGTKILNLQSIAIP